VLWQEAETQKVQEIAKKVITLGQLEEEELRRVSTVVVDSILEYYVVVFN
jgi:hypothetical protein